MRPDRFHLTSAPYCSAPQPQWKLPTQVQVASGSGDGYGSAPFPRLNLLAGGSLTSPPGGFFPPTGGLNGFHTPQTSVGCCAVPPHCQSPARLPKSVVMSVMNSAGQIGRFAGSVASTQPICGLLTHAGALGVGCTVQ